MLVILVVAGGAAGGWRGAMMMAALFLPIYLHGAYHRSVYDWQQSENEGVQP